MLIPCPECSNRISSNASFCPDCGFPDPGNQPDEKTPVFFEYIIPDSIRARICSAFGYATKVELGEVSGIISEQSEDSESEIITTEAHENKLGLGKIQTYGFDGFEPVAAGPSIVINSQKKVSVKTDVKIKQQLWIKNKEGHVRPLSFVNWNVGARNGDKIVALVVKTKVLKQDTIFALINVTRGKYYDDIDNLIKLEPLKLGCGLTCAGTMFAVIGAIIGGFLGGINAAAGLALIFVLLICASGFLSYKLMLSVKNYLKEALVFISHDIFLSDEEGIES